MTDRNNEQQTAEMVGLLLNDKVSQEQILEVLQSHVVQNHVDMIQDLCIVLQTVHASLSIGLPNQETVNTLVANIEKVLTRIQN